MIDVTKLQRDFQSVTPPEAQVVVVGRTVALETRAYADQAIDTITNKVIGATFGNTIVLGPLLTWLGTQPQLELVRQQIEDLAEIVDRVDNVYLPALEGLPDDAPLPPAVRPLIRNVSGVGYMTPEYLGPPSVLNQFDQLSIVNGRLAREWESAVYAQIAEYVATATEAAKAAAREAAKTVAGAIPWGWLILGVGVAGGVALWRRSK